MDASVRKPTRTVTILGSTGSVGVNTIDLIERHNARAPESYRVVALTANESCRVCRYKSVPDAAMIVRKRVIASRWLNLLSASSRGLGSARVSTRDRRERRFVNGRSVGSSGAGKFSFGWPFEVAASDSFSSGTRFTLVSSASGSTSTLCAIAKGAGTEFA